jgi:hypothetical protein
MIVCRHTGHAFQVQTEGYYFKNLKIRTHLEEAVGILEVDRQADAFQIQTKMTWAYV